MIVMPANNRKALVHFLAGKHPGLLGHLYSPPGERAIYPWLPYALDNGAFPAWNNGEPWNAEAFRRLLAWATRQAQPPRWVLVPDVVADRAATLARWREWAPYVRAYGWPLAFAAQDGMTPADVPADADVVFLGGGTEWKRAAIAPWCKAFPRVHVGRINTYEWLSYCERAGAESCDGTGWFRGDPIQLRGLVRWLEETSTGRQPAPLTAAELVPIRRPSDESPPPERQTSLSFGATGDPTGPGGRSSGAVETAACTADRAPVADG